MVSVIVCTYNRSDSLRITLADIGGLRAPAGHDVEVLVVDNNSTDATRAVVLEASKAMPFPVRYLCEQRQGQSFARNRGIEEAQGDWIAFTDDDVRIGQDWLAALMAAAEQSGKSIVGGRVEAVWPASVPRWVATGGPLLETIIFVHYDQGDQRRELGPDDPLPPGCNLALERSVLARIGLFSVNLGHTAGRPIGGEDTEFLERARAAGYAILYAPDALVHHPVEPARLRFRYLLTRRLWEGYGFGFSGQVPVGRWGLPPRYVFRQVAQLAAQAVVAAVKGDRPASAHICGCCVGRIGVVLGCRSAYQAVSRRNQVPFVNGQAIPTRPLEDGTIASRSPKVTGS